MQLSFHKYHGTGNDFIVIDNRNEVVKASQNKLFKHLCNRRFGIGADGVILLQNHRIHNFEMRYLNADGFESSMCGNGGRCIVEFARKLELIKEYTDFYAADGLHEAKVVKPGYVSLKMSDVKKITFKGEDYEMDTGSPHYVQIVESISGTNVKDEGRKIRYSETYFYEGINVDFVEVINPNCVSVRTYERGVEDETLSCGTGVVAATIAAGIRNNHFGHYKCEVITPGGELHTHFFIDDNSIKEIWLEGPATFVFEGKIEI